MRAALDGREAGDVAAVHGAAQLADARLVWVDALWIDEQGGLWIPAAQMNRTPAMNGGEASAVKFPTTIYRMQIDAKPLRN